jgi:hypothetical protein
VEGVNLMKVYIGKRDADDILSVFVRIGEVENKVDPRSDLRNHSIGFECGYSGSGPAQLALAICADVLGDDERALDVYQKFKVSVIAGLPREVDWELTEAQVLEGIIILTTAEPF